MPPIKINSSGLVITKGGLPSCACCGECSQCDPSSIYVSIESGAYYWEGYIDLSMTFNVGEGYCEGDAQYFTLSNGVDTIEGFLQIVAGDWSIDGVAFGYGSSRCDPSGSYREFFESPSEVVVTAISPP